MKPINRIKTGLFGKLRQRFLKKPARKNFFPFSRLDLLVDVQLDRYLIEEAFE